eukprot:8203517-Heterocapsa_arctica.AAC.1
MEDITMQEELVATMRTDVKNKRSQIWRLWVENSWAHKTNDAHKWCPVGHECSGRMLMLAVAA